MPSGGHASGYLDSNMIIPELVIGIQFRKGPYFAEDGDFSAAGSANVSYLNLLEQPVASISTGGQGWSRFFGAASPNLGDGNLLVGVEVGRNDGPWVEPDDLRKMNGILRYSRGDTRNGFSITGLSYSAKWHATDQVPVRAIESGRIDRFAGIDTTGGGRIYRHGIVVDILRSNGETSTRITAFGMRYGLNLLQNFTYFLANPVDGDQFEQVDRRTSTGGKLIHRRLRQFLGRPMEWKAGTQLRHDDASARVEKGTVTFSTLPVSTKAGQLQLRRYVEGHDHAIRLKSEIVVDHFHTQVLSHGKIGGRARAMVVTNGIERAIQYYHAIRDYLKERKSRYQAIVDFSGKHEYGGAKLSESKLNGFPSNKIAERFQEDPYRFLVCADKFQTGYDEPLLHTMYVDKTLSGIKAVQTLSRLNRAHPKKHDVFVLDFLNESDTIRDAFADYYRGTILSEETDPNKLHDLQADLDGAQVYSSEQVKDFASRYLDGEDREELDPILEACVEVYLQDLDEDGQVQFKRQAKGFVRTYAFLSSILPYNNARWEERSIFLNFLVSKLPSPREEDMSKGILDAIDMDSYRVEKKAMQKILLPDDDAEIDPSSDSGSGGHAEPELDLLSNIIKAFNDLFGNIPWEDGDRVLQLITETIPSRVAQDTAFRNAQKNSDRENARIEHDKALLRVMMAVMKDDTQLFKKFMDDPDFKQWMSNLSFRRTYKPTGPP